MERRSAKARVLASRLVYRGSIFDVRRDRVREPGGIVTWREVVVHSGSVVLVPVLDDGRILMVRQYRHATGRRLWELVAGGIERGERADQAARRELEEETGYRGSRYRRLIEFFPTPGFVSERMVVYLVRGLRRGHARPEADEDLEVRAFRWPELERRIRSGRIQDGKSLAGLLYYGRFFLSRARTGQ
jgi:ADP-ribose pyrophosphatase